MSPSTPITLKLVTPFDDQQPVFVAGNFCEWYPDVKEFEMKKIGKGEFFYQFPDDFNFAHNIEYKYTRGGWNQVELDYYGNPSINRRIKRIGEQVDFVPFWRINGKNFNEKKMPIIETIEEFEIPQLTRSRRIHVLLPADYKKKTTHYPVLYLLDAQNLFGGGSEFGNWKIDEKMSILKSRGKGDFIVVAIEHGHEKRFDEFSPYKIAKGGGEGKKFANFIAKTLKPYIDEKYRTLPAPENTTVGGSSLGGLLSLYTGIMYSEIIGKMIVFSPSLWVSNKIFFDVEEFFNPKSSKLYLYAGGHESKSMLADTEKLKTTFEKMKLPITKFNIESVVNQQGGHSEVDWSKEFTAAAEWMTE